ncbi:trypsin-like cysteine/serine peptidase domain-containing protein [Thamnocephalis sphaerospora]|uniref:Trypsin-like cysteine/serine peptidase domain-containing protein n=1 Tax=Thamnocephalis sphaerospora TaxID=78915 RepID=A0A4P9XUN5_9FUNG|nr:trypsin-like cysteine/serine peptidase domain-containing protein [Thamnocephalis sphaerospora]|eukprot:RKP09682.1 trypsin-like cysteine/serine peptidase domain-containing protein [Thamnocephalis sphaerospora]
MHHTTRLFATAVLGIVLTASMAAAAPADDSNGGVATPMPRAKQLKIVGGSAAKADEFPFAVNIHVRGISACGATLISDRWVYTAAHCLIDYTASSNAGSNVKYQAAQLTLNIGKLSNATTTPLAVKQTIVHPDYVYSGSTYDAGLIELTQPITFSDAVQPIKLLLKEAQIPRDQVYTVVGWGRNEANQKSPFLQRVDLPSAKEDACVQAQGDFEKQRDQLLCVGNTQGKDTCRGDSGGPLLIQVRSSGGTGKAAAEAWVQAGVTSFGANTMGLDPNLCGTSGAIGFYARTDFFASWVAQSTGMSISQFASELPPMFTNIKSDVVSINGSGNQTGSNATASASQSSDAASFAAPSLLALSLTTVGALLQAYCFA